MWLERQLLGSSESDGRSEILLRSGEDGTVELSVPSGTSHQWPALGGREKPEFRHSLVLRNGVAHRASGRTFSWCRRRWASLIPSRTPRRTIPYNASRPRTQGDEATRRCPATRALYAAQPG